MSADKREIATFGAGCFWGVEETFRQIEGVTATAVGYMGGSVTNPTYRQVCSDTTGHAEVCQVEFDSSVVSFAELLEVFWKVHDPTQVNRQGPDHGTQYRTAIFYYSDQQKEAAEKSIAALAASGRFDRPIATEVTPAREFWRAEDYHQRYLQKRGLPGCSIN
ncbi:MAG TPA: peptide-methionine (S)-S-oxide reductase MsrA [candidate division Zixibacteria bacterium]|nr:peptide-methionine (S)-S-oxide reductase MsrA [candidate division Zixibacteria bacterium]